jgi:hypothetical protein
MFRSDLVVVGGVRQYRAGICVKVKKNTKTCVCVVHIIQKRNRGERDYLRVVS